MKVTFSFNTLQKKKETEKDEVTGHPRIRVRSFYFFNKEGIAKTEC